MPREKLFLDTSFVQAWFNRRDQYHQPARQLAQRRRDCQELWTTEAVLLEIGSAFRAPQRRAIATAIWDEFHRDPRCRLAAISGALLARAVDLFRGRPDKTWSLTDCAAFVLMDEQRLTAALTCDHHFTQAGFRALLLEESNA